MGKYSLANALVVTVCLLVMPGCAKDELISRNYRAVDRMISSSRAPLRKQQRILVATFVDLDNYEQSSSLGRLTGEQAASRLVQKGFNVISTNIREESIAIKQREGQFLLSRHVLDLSDDYGAELVLVGTFTTGAPHKIYVSMRLVRVSDNALVAAHDYTLRKTHKINALLEGRGGTWQHINLLRH